MVLALSNIKPPFALLLVVVTIIATYIFITNRGTLANIYKISTVEILVAPCIYFSVPIFIMKKTRRLQSHAL